MVTKISKEANLHWISMVETLQLRSSPNHKWIPPPSGWHKINTDITFELDSAYSGIVLRNEHGTIIDAASNHNTCLDTTTAECIALWEACILISNKKRDNVIFESDSLNAISFLIGEPKNCYWKASPIIDQIRRI
ncbi:hypothetical protein CASFOL_037124 [Castilleja foliolosa]|uniref:RNase H type-1 domain-containing protein n=1 Tax=Castilleja foliolosa TaxID=1961234 RepID=A0ABD3BPH9_9LAMI